MKKIQNLLISLLLFLGGYTQAQNYNLFKMGNTCFYHAANIGTVTVSIDSVTENNLDSIFHFKPIVRYNENSTMSCYNINSPSWMGDCAIKRIDNSWIINNLNNDSVVIYTDKAIGESWICYKPDSSIYITATVDSVLHEDVFNYTDSVKYISFKAYNGSGTAISNIISSYSLRIGKNTGLIETPGLAQFPDLVSGETIFPLYFFEQQLFTLIGETPSGFGQQNITKFDVYDFLPGDELHTKEISTSPYAGNIHWDTTWQIKKFLQRASYADSIVYTVQTISKTAHHTPTAYNSVYYNYTADEVVYNDSLFNAFPFQPLIEEDAVYIFKQNGNVKTKISEGEYLLLNSDTCYSWIMADGCLPEYNYYRGLGGPYYACDGFFGEHLEKTMVYYKKGITTWGTPLIIDSVGITELETVSEPTVFPNPANEFITIKVKEDNLPCEISIYTNNGQKIQTNLLTNKESIIEVSKLSSGLYFYRIENNKISFKSGKFIINH